MQHFEDVLEQYEPMITSILFRLHIYHEHEHFRQAGRTALWQAWMKYDETAGHFAPYAYRTIRGALMDELKKEVKSAKYEAMWKEEYDSLLAAPEQEDCWSFEMENVLGQVTPAERQLIHCLFIERWTYAECARQFNISVAGFKKRRERVIKKLKQLLT